MCYKSKYMYVLTAETDKNNIMCLYLVQSLSYFMSFDQGCGNSKPQTRKTSLKNSVQIFSGL